MSDHKKPMTPELRQALINHGHPTDTPSQLADSFRHGWLAALAAQPATVPDCEPEAFAAWLREQLIKKRDETPGWSFSFRRGYRYALGEVIAMLAAPKPEHRQ